MDLLLYNSITINEYRNILNVIKERFGFDFNDYSLVHLKRRVECFMASHRYSSAESLINHILRDDEFINSFLKEIVVESTEMFRDPSFWRYLRDFLIPRIISEHKIIKILLPYCTSGDELYSLSIILAENNWFNYTEIYAYTPHILFEKNIKNGYFASNKFEVSADNYLRFQGKKEFSEYFFKDNEKLMRKNTLIEQVIFLQQNPDFSNLIDNVQIILFRNKLIYHNQTLQEKILKTFYDKLSKNGYLLLGIRERPGIISQNLFRQVNENESIYVKN